MFKIPPDVAQAWARMNEPKADAGTVQHLEVVLGFSLPPAYVEFITRHGFVVFGRDPERRWRFTYTMEDGHGQREVRQQSVAYLFNPGDVPVVYRNTTTPDPDDDTLPSFPPDYLPVASDRGQGCVLLEIRPVPGRVWYWPARAARWGTDGNTRLGRVADNFHDFINHLEPDPL